MPTIEEAKQQINEAEKQLNNYSKQIQAQSIKPLTKTDLLRKYNDLNQKNYRNLSERKFSEWKEQQNRIISNERINLENYKKQVIQAERDAQEWNLVNHLIINNRQVNPNQLPPSVRSKYLQVSGRYSKVDPNVYAKLQAQGLPESVIRAELGNQLYTAFQPQRIIPPDVNTGYSPNPFIKGGFIQQRPTKALLLGNELLSGIQGSVTLLNQAKNINWSSKTDLLTTPKRNLSDVEKAKRIRSLDVNFFR